MLVVTRRMIWGNVHRENMQKSLVPSLINTGVMLSVQISVACALYTIDGEHFATPMLLDHVDLEGEPPSTFRDQWQKDLCGHHATCTQWWTNSTAAHCTSAGTCYMQPCTQSVHRIQGSIAQFQISQPDRDVQLEEQATRRASRKAERSC